MDPPPGHGEESYRGNGRLDGRKAVVTGGDSGIGRAVCLAFAREGADVMFTHLEEEKDEAQQTADLVSRAGQRALPIQRDIREEAVCRALIDQAAREFGRIDILVNNAAYQMSQPEGIEAISPDQFDRVLRTNLYGMFWLSKFAVPHIPEGGSIINSTSVQAYKPSPHLLDYAMTKGAIVTFTQGLAQMLIDRGIRVNAVAPGPVWTPLIPATLPDTWSSASRPRSAVRHNRRRWPRPMSSLPPMRRPSSPPRSSMPPAERPCRRRPSPPANRSRNPHATVFGARAAGVSRTSPTRPTRPAGL